MQIARKQQYNFLPPHAALREHVLYYNIVFPEGDTFTAHYTLLPNACGTLSLAFDGSEVLAELWGASLTPTLLGAEPNGYHVLLLVQLSPTGLYQITRQGQAALADRRFRLEEVDGALFSALCDAFVEAKTVEDLALLCDDILYRRLERPVVSQALLLADRTICERHGQVRVEEVARQAGYSQRQLNRLFLSQVGLNVKNYARLVRFNYVLKHIPKSPGLLAALSQQAGYYDQAHFDKDFKAISGVTPQAYLRNMSHFYYDVAEILGTLIP